MSSANAVVCGRELATTEHQQVGIAAAQGMPVGVGEYKPESKQALNSPRECDESADDIDSVSADSDTEGSLKDFVVKGECDESESENAPSESDSDGINVSNILTTKRRRIQTQFYDREVFMSKEYASMMLCDIPSDEMKAALEDEDFSDDEDDTFSSEGESDN